MHPDDPDVQNRHRMSNYRLTNLIRPRSVAVIGGSPRAGSVGRAVVNNLRAAGFAGPIGLVNRRGREIDGLAAVTRLKDLPEVPELIVVTTPPATVPDIIDTAGAAGVAAAIVVTAGLGHGPGGLFPTEEPCKVGGGGSQVDPDRLLGGSHVSPNTGVQDGTMLVVRAT